MPLHLPGAQVLCIAVVPAMLQYVLESEAKLSWLAQLEKAQSKQQGVQAGGSSHWAASEAAGPEPHAMPLQRKRTGQWGCYLVVLLMCFMSCDYLVDLVHWLGLAPVVTLPAR